MGSKIENSKVTAIADIDPLRIEFFKKHTKNNDITYFDNASDLIKSHLIDAILIETPHYDHPKIAIEAMKNNINVIVELNTVKYEV